MLVGNPTCIIQGCTRPNATAWICGGVVHHTLCVEHAAGATWRPPRPPPQPPPLVRCDCGKHDTLSRYRSCAHVDWTADSDDLACALLDIAETACDEIQYNGPVHDIGIDYADMTIAIVGMSAGDEIESFAADHMAHDGGKYDDPTYIEITWSMESIEMIDGVCYVTFTGA